MDYNIPGYSIHPINLDNKIGRGLAVYSKEELDKSVIQIDGDSSFEEICSLEIRLHGGDLLLLGVSIEVQQYQSHQNLTMKN